jgi:hypothetical protein
LCRTWKKLYNEVLFRYNGKKWFKMFLYIGRITGTGGEDARENKNAGYCLHSAGQSSCRRI